MFLDAISPSLSFNFVWCVATSHPLDSVADALCFPIDFHVVSWLGIVVILGFMFVVIVVLLNILIAQLSDTYQNVQSDAQREVELNRAYIVGHVEKNSLLYKVCFSVLF